MKIRFLFLTLVLFAGPAWSQVEPGAVGGVVNPDDNERMMVPPPVSGMAYPTLTTGEQRSNFLRLGLVLIGSYNDNILAGYAPAPVSDEIYSVFPTVMLDQTTPRQHRTLSYSPGFTFYQKTTQLNAVAQNANVNWEVRMSPRVIMSVADAFAQNSNTFSQPAVSQGGIVASPTPGQNAIVIAPFANQLMNDASAQMTYQFGLNGMVGGSGETSLFNYPNLSQTPGLFDSTEYSGSAFYSRRFSLRQYLGLIDKYAYITTSPVATTTDTNAVFVFFTTYLGLHFNASILAGPQYFKSSEPGVNEPGTWEPAVTASFGWQSNRTSLSGSYSRVVTGGGGLLGAYTTDTGEITGRWVIAKTWNATAGATYYVLKNATPQLPETIPGGRTLTANGAVTHILSEHFNVQAIYQRLHQSYSGIAYLSSFPDSNQITVALTYQFSRPLGR